jgi:hypothetical protein
MRLASIIHAKLANKLRIRDYVTYSDSSSLDSLCFTIVALQVSEHYSLILDLLYPRL